jgi:uncharacterized protein with HEPN domain
MIRAVRHRLTDIEDNIVLVASLVKDRTLAQFQTDLAFRYAVQYAVLIIAEAVGRLPPDLRSKFPNTPWPNIIAIGHKLRHEYHRIDADIIWEVATLHLEPLRAVVKQMNQAEDPSPATMGTS